MQGADVFFLLMGAILVFAMHGGFAFLEAGTVRHKNQVNALVKILVDFAISTVVYFLIGYTIAYGVGFFAERRGDRRRRRRLRGAGLHARPLLLPLHLRRRRAGDRLRRHRRARQVRAASAWRPRRSSACSIRCSKASYWNDNFGLQETFFKARARRAVQGLRRLDRRARLRRLGGARRRAACSGRGSAATTRTRHRHPAVVDPVARHGLLAAVHRLVRLQRDERAAPRSRVGSRRHELADGHVRRHHRGAHRRR